MSLSATFLAARWLGPRDFGRAQFVILFYAYASLIRSGVFEGGMRAFIHLRGGGEQDEALKSQNVGLSFELAVSLVPGLLLAAVAIWSRDPVQRLGFVVAPLAVMGSSGAAFLAGMYMARERFNIISTVTIVRAVIYAGSLLIGVEVFGAVGAVLAPVVADLLAVAVYCLRASGLSVSLAFDRVRGWKLVRAGFPLGASAIVYWAYRLVGSTSVAIALPTAVLGVYMFALAPLALLLRAQTSVQAVLIPALWGEMASERRDEWIRASARISVALAAVAAFATNLVQAGFGPGVYEYLPKFRGAVGLFDLLVMNVLLLSLSVVPSLVLDSAVVNRQTVHLAIFVGGFTLNLVANVVVLHSGLGAHAVASNDLWVQAVVVVVVHAVAARHLPGKQWRSARLWLVGITTLTSLVAVGLHFGPQTAHGLIRVILLVASRSAVVICAWALPGLALRGWIQTAPAPLPLDGPLENAS